MAVFKVEARGIMPKDHYIELVGKIVRLIEALRDEPDGLSLKELTVRTGYVKSSIHRILHSLKKHGYTEQLGPGGAYRLGTQLLLLASGFSHDTALVQLARPYMRELLGTFQETTCLAVLRGDRCIFVDVQEAQRALRLVAPLRPDVHYHATAAGKVIAAFLPRDRRSEILKERKLERVTPKTLTSASQVERDWAQVKQLGFAVNNEETVVGALFLAAPIFDSQGSVSASISIGIPKPRYSELLGKRVATQLKDSCQRLSASLKAAGYRHETQQLKGA